MFEFVEPTGTSTPVATMCRELSVSTSGYFEWRTRPRSARAVYDEIVAELIRGAHDESRRT